MNTVVIGGSLTGLMSGLMLKRLGNNVRILEQSTSSSRNNTAAGMSTGPNGKAFLDSHDLDERPLSFACVGPQFVDKHGNMTRNMNTSLNLTSWDVLYHRLRANFDGFASDYCPTPPSSLDSDGEAVYNIGKRAVAIVFNDGLITVAFDDLINGGRSSCVADLVIVADGANSTIRKQLAPQSRLKYAGYVGWRGTVPEEEVSKETRAFFDKGLFTSVLPGDHGYMVGYAMPGKHGTLQRGHRDFNFVWYSKMPSSSTALAEALTDRDSHHHHSTLPKGKMNPNVWSRQLNASKDAMLPAFREVCSKVTEPFISTINDCSAPRASYFHHQVLLAGEALLLVRPHTSISFDTAAYQVMQLKRAMSGQMTLKEWERQVLSHSRKVELFALAYGRYFVHGMLRPSFWWSLVRLVVFFLWAYLRILLRRGR